MPIDASNPYLNHPTVFSTNSTVDLLVHDSFCGDLASLHWLDNIVYYVRSAWTISKSLLSWHLEGYCINSRSPLDVYRRWVNNAKNCIRNQWRSSSPSRKILIFKFVHCLAFMLQIQPTMLFICMFINMWIMRIRYDQYKGKELLSLPMLRQQMKVEGQQYYTSIVLDSF